VRGYLSGEFVSMIDEASNFCPQLQTVVTSVQEALDFNCADELELYDDGDED
jgi:hypothetical protein